MRKTFLVVPAVLAATLVPSVGKAEVHKCHGQVATIVSTTGDRRCGSKSLGRRWRS